MPVTPAMATIDAHRCAMLGDARAMSFYFALRRFFSFS